MMKRLQGIPFALAIVAVVLADASNAHAQIRRVETGRHAVGFNVGYYMVPGEEARANDDDVLINDLSSAQALAFDIKDFNGVNFGGEYVLGISNYLEAGFGLNYYQRTVASVYADFQNANGSEIEQDLKLRIIPISATVRFLPIGRAGVTPYVGGGLGIFPWRYSEVGEFVDESDFSIFRDQYVSSGTAVGPVILGGVRVPVGDVWTVGGEIRYQHAKGSGLRDDRMLGDTINLGGWTTSFTFHLRF
jgi:opacity protein-like surface antigen